MSTIIKTEVTTKIYLELTEGEARALKEICAYNPSAFKEWFYKKLGNSYLKPWEQHLDSLFNKGRALGSAISQIDKARKAIKDLNLPKVLQ